MRRLSRIALLAFLPTVIIAIIFLGKISFDTALRLGEWGERSIAESTLVVAGEKIERIEQAISRTERAMFDAIDPTQFEGACARWKKTQATEKLIAIAAILDDEKNVVGLYYRSDQLEQAGRLTRLLETSVVPLIDKYDSLDQFKHLHRQFDREYHLITHYTKQHEGRDFTTVLIFDNRQILDSLFSENLASVGADLLSNVVDDHGSVLFGQRLSDRSGPFMVVKRFPSTFYRWRLQLSPRSAEYIEKKAEAGRISKVMLIPLAFGIIVFGLAVLYLTVVREKRLNRLKSEFIANVSHELKTPLSLIRMFGELLTMQRADNVEKTKKYQEIILRETDRLTSLIDNVLDFAKIERGKSAYDFEINDIAETVERATDIFQNRISDLGLELKFHTADNLPTARFDEHSITLVVVNLVDNALKYATGATFVGVRLTAPNKHIHLDVYDNGAGIAPNHLRRIFERFYRIPSPSSRKQRGSGIGLSLVRHIATAHGGEVIVTSEPGVETRFSVRLPIASRRLQPTSTSQ